MLLDAFHDQARAVSLLQKAWRHDRLAHAYTLVGPQGVGQLRLARAMAAARICAEAEWDACGECATCRRVLGGLHPDVLVVEPDEKKRDISIAQIRELCDALALKPFEAPLRTVIINGADRMQADAANTFLKTLEEPSGQTLFLLLADEWERLLATIQSRSHLIRLAPLPASRVPEVVAESVADDKKAPDLSELPSVLPIAQGSPEAALELMRVEFPALVEMFTHGLSDPDAARFREPITLAKTLLSAAKPKGAGVLEEARKRLKPLARLAASWCRDAWLTQWTAAQADAAELEMLSTNLPFDPASASAELWLDRWEALLDLIYLLDRNLNLDIWTTKLVDTIKNTPA